MPDEVVDKPIMCGCDSNRHLCGYWVKNSNHYCFTIVSLVTQGDWNRATLNFRPTDGAAAPSQPELVIFQRYQEEVTLPQPGTKLNSVDIQRGSPGGPIYLASGTIIEMNVSEYDQNNPRPSAPCVAIYCAQNGYKWDEFGDLKFEFASDGHMVSLVLDIKGVD